jgi:Uncharacterized MobA-related protein
MSFSISSCAVILADGHSSRMGQCKALLRIGGVTIVLVTNIIFNKYHRRILNEYGGGNNLFSK